MLALLSLSSERLPVRSFRHFEMSSCHFCLCRFRCVLRALLECHRFLCSADCAASIEMFPVIFLFVEPTLDRSPIHCRRTNALVLLHRAFRFAFPLHDQPDELRSTRIRNTYPQHHDQTHVHARVCTSNLIECHYLFRLNILVSFGFVAPLMFHPMIQHIILPQIGLAQGKYN